MGSSTMSFRNTQQVPTTKFDASHYHTTRANFWTWVVFVFTLVAIAMILVGTFTHNPSIFLMGMVPVAIAAFAVIPIGKHSRHRRQIEHEAGWG